METIPDRTLYITEAIAEKRKRECGAESGRRNLGCLFLVLNLLFPHSTCELRIAIQRGS
jgi:hypothetical protein